MLLPRHYTHHTLCLSFVLRPEAVSCLDHLLKPYYRTILPPRGNTHHTYCPSSVLTPEVSGIPLTVTRNLSTAAFSSGVCALGLHLPKLALFRTGQQGPEPPSSLSTVCGLSCFSSTTGACASIVRELTTDSSGRGAGRPTVALVRVT